VKPVKQGDEFENFDRAMDDLLKVSPSQIKADQKPRSRKSPKRDKEG
jgi:hypothetical protein